MSGLDDQIAALGNGGSFVVVAVIAMVLGLRHATDPDHLTAVTTLVAGDRPDKRAAGRLGLAWGLGHATSLVVFGVPIVLYRAYLPEGVQMGAEAAVGVVIVALALRVLVRRHPSGDHAHGRRARTGRQAYGIGLVHGMGGSAGVGVLLLASIPGHAAALAALALFAGCTALSMAAASTTVGLVLTRDAVSLRLARVVPALGMLSLAFGLWYTLGAVDAVPYVF